MKRSGYLPRLADAMAEEYLQLFGAICIEGAKWCGKTWCASVHAKSEINIGSTEGNFQARELAKISPIAVLEGATPRLVDEWQEVPALWDAVRTLVDERGQAGQFILTGSSTSLRKGVMHSGIGRIATIRMRPMSLFESRNSSGAVSLRDICENREIKPLLVQEVQLETIIGYIVRGGWPGNLRLSVSQAAKVAANYVDTLVNYDLERAFGKRRDKRKLGLLLRSLARNESTLVSNRTLAEDIKERDGGAVTADTVSEYVSVLEQLFIVDNQMPFASQLRSSAKVRQAEKRHLCDPSLACALLGATPKKLMGDLKTLGLLFEAMCERDLKIYAEANGASLSHYRDTAGNEIDAVVETAEGSWSAFEIKLGADKIDMAAEKLLKLSRKITNSNGNPPASLCVLCGVCNAAYRRADGVYVIPITALRN